MQKRGSVRHIVPFGQSKQESGFLHVTDFTGQGGIWQGYTSLSQIVPLGQASQSEITKAIKIHFKHILDSGC